MNFFKLKPTTLLAIFPLLFRLSSTGIVDFDPTTNSCTIHPDPSGADDALAVIDAFNQCGHDGSINFLNTTYNIESVMNTTNLSNCLISLKGTLLWGTNFTYWTSYSIPIGFQNQSSAWFLGGENVTFRGYDYGTLNGNGQAWYDYVDGVNNYPGRPHALTIWESKDSLFEGLRFVQSQMWTMEVMHSSNILLQDIFVNNTNNNDKSDQNSDGADTLYSHNITFRRWYVENGDDSISAKENSSEIYIEDCAFKRGLGVALGSIGQYDGAFEYIDGVYAKNITCINTSNAGYIKTWTGIPKSYPPNGGGGGTGYIRNIQLSDFTFINSKYIFGISQCTTYSFNFGDCDTSTMAISNVTLGPIKGTLQYEPDNLGLQCSGARPCPGIEFRGLDLEWEGRSVQPVVNCSHVVEPRGFVCAGGNETVS